MTLQLVKGQMQLPDLKPKQSTFVWSFELNGRGRKQLNDNGCVSLVRWRSKSEHGKLPKFKVRPHDEFLFSAFKAEKPKKTPKGNKGRGKGKNTGTGTDTGTNPSETPTADLVFSHMKGLTFRSQLLLHLDVVEEPYLVVELRLALQAIVFLRAPWVCSTRDIVCSTFEFRFDL